MTFTAEPFSRLSCNATIPEDCAAAPLLTQREIPRPTSRKVPETGPRRAIYFRHLSDGTILAIPRGSLSVNTTHPGAAGEG